MTKSKIQTCHLSFVDDPYFSLGQQSLGCFVDQPIEVDPISHQLIGVAVTIPGGAVGGRDLEVKSFLQKKPGGHIVYVKRGFKGSVGSALESCDFPAFGVEGVGVVDD